MNPKWSGSYYPSHSESGWIQPLLTVQSKIITGTFRILNGLQQNFLTFRRDIRLQFVFFQFQRQSWYRNFVIGYKAAFMYKMCASVSDPAIYCKRNELEMKWSLAECFRQRKIQDERQKRSQAREEFWKRRLLNFFFVFFCFFLSSFKLTSPILFLLFFIVLLFSRLNCFSSVSHFLFIQIFHLVFTLRFSFFILFCSLIVILKDFFLCVPFLYLSVINFFFSTFSLPITIFSPPCMYFSSLLFFSCITLFCTVP